jgi:GH43 family beta-xylosidase
MNDNKERLSRFFSLPLIGILSILNLTACDVVPIDIPDDTTIKNTYFTNPIRETGADPWMIKHNGKYYMSESDGHQTIFIMESTSITGFKNAIHVPILSFGLGDYITKYAVWGPHLDYIQGNWYIYYAAQSIPDTQFTSQRMWVLKSTTSSPYGPYEDLGEVIGSNDSEWAIDGSIIERANGDLYFTWSGIPNLTNLHQASYIAKMSSPTQIDRATITQISYPTYAWETSVRPIQEGQRPLIIDKNGKTIIMFSANASWTNEYCLGSLTNTDGNFLNASSWTKSPLPLFKKTNLVFGPGGASYVKSPDDTEDWIIYHAAKSNNSGWSRNIRAQKFSWTTSGDPFFGEPIAPGYMLIVPSGE